MAESHLKELAKIRNECNSLLYNAIKNALKQNKTKFEDDIETYDNMSEGTKNAARDLWIHQMKEILQNCRDNINHILIIE